MIKTKHSKHLI